MRIMNTVNKRTAYCMAIFLMIMLLFCTGCTHNEESSSSDQSSEVEQADISITDSGTYYDYAYGSDPLQRLDLVIPEETSAVKGLYVIIHGGAWISGDKEEFKNSIKNAASHGYVSAAINYRFISESIHMDDILDDITAALVQIKTLAEGRGVELHKVVFSGWSAGAHIALLYAYKCADVSPIPPAAVISYCGPTDLIDPAFIEESDLGDKAGMLDLLNKLCGVSISEEDYNNQTGNYEEWRSALQFYSPVYCVTENSVPTVMGHGKKDTIVPFSNAVKLDEVLTTNSVTHQFIVFPKSGHNLDQDAESIKQISAAESQYVQTYLNDEP